MGDDQDQEIQMHNETSPLVGDVDSNRAEAARDDEIGDRETTFLDDVLDTLHLAGPIFVSRVSWVGVSSSGGRLATVS